MSDLPPVADVEAVFLDALEGLGLSSCASRIWRSRGRLEAVGRGSEAETLLHGVLTIISGGSGPASELG